MKKIFLLAAICIAASFAVASAQDALTMKDFVLSASRPYGIGAMNSAPGDGNHYYRLVDKKKIMRYSYKDSKTEQCVYATPEADGFENIKWDGFKVCGNGSHILLWTNSEPIYRYSIRADYYVADVVSGHTVKLSADGHEEIATMSPDGSKIAYVKDNNIFIKKLHYENDSQGMVDDGAVQVTSDGKINSVINGLPDWVYQEEFGILNSLTWSPDGKTLAFIRWDESKVPMASMTMYEGSCKPDSARALYPGHYEFKYPVAGEDNSEVSLWCYDTEASALKKIGLPMTDEDYLPHIAFSGRNDCLMVTKLNRLQNDLHIFSINPATGSVADVYRDTSDSWVDSELANSVTYTDRTFVVPSERDGWAHLYEYTLDGKFLRQLTTGNEAVTEYYGYDSKRKLHFFQSTAGPLDRVIKCVDSKGKVTVLGTTKGTHKATFGSDYSYYIENYSDALTPNQYTIRDFKGKKVRDLQLNEKYAQKFAPDRVPRREFVTFSNDGYELNGFIIKPLDFDPNKKYPVIMTQYSGPGSQQVLNNWGMDWREWFAMQGYIIACFDGRGTGGRGKAFESIIYRNLGKYETIDQIAAARHMASLPYVDADRIGIWGWSFGGYEVLMAMSQPNSCYAAGVSIAPVTSWRYYDTIYTERYMRTPQENKAGYDYSPLGLAENLKGDLLLMFGSADDNVHITNEMQYISKLHLLGSQFNMMVYTNMNHSINGCDVRLPLYQRVLNHFDRTLKNK
ncbi:MAG: S9 family peptidase [Bacteroidales bacterium]|nr:S9 family peptidase [Candidatus Sodaliphilus aphodohippi]